jgi:hypothetical protein
MGVAIAPAANADMLCHEVYGATLGYDSYAGRCAPYDGGTLCVDRDAGFDPITHYWIVACVPE